MKCPKCSNELVWNSDFDYEDNDEYAFYNFYICEPCNVEVVINHPKEEE
jgi:hypothetical protein